MLTASRILTICSTIDKVADLKKEFRTKALAVESATEVLQAISLQTTSTTSTTSAARSETTEVKKNKAMKQKVTQHQELEAVGKRLKTAKRKVDDQLAIEAKRQCRQLCEKVYQILPRELRNIIYSELLTDNNATFCKCTCTKCM